MHSKVTIQADDALGLGVKAVIAKSYAFIYGRNQASLGLLGVIVEDEAFYEAATDHALVSIDIRSRTIRVGEGSDAKDFPFTMSEMEYRLMANKGISAAYGKFKNEVWKHMVKDPASQKERDVPMGARVDKILDKPVVDSRLQW